MAASHPAEGMFVVRQTPSTVLCCLCGTPMPPNATGMCAACIRTHVDITEGLPKHLTVMHCPECARWLQPPQAWIKADPESKELLTFCLKVNSHACVYEKLSSCQDCFKAPERSSKSSMFPPMALACGSLGRSVKRASENHDSKLACLV